MSLFLLSFLLIYGSFHLYFFLKAKAAFTLPRWIFFLLAVFLLVMIAAPILVRISERIGYDQLAIFLAYFGYTWMGIVFLFAAASLVVDGCRIIIWILSIARLLCFRFFVWNAFTQIYKYRQQNLNHIIKWSPARNRRISTLA